MVVCLGFFQTARGQEVTAAVTGIVVDPTGASIVGATITAKDWERETTYRVQTNSAGIFHVSVARRDVRPNGWSAGLSDRGLLIDHASPEPDCPRSIPI
jgi:hypothetical protein